MAKGRDFRFGIGLIVVGEALIALDIWLIITFHLPPVTRRGGGAALGILGLVLLAIGVTVPLGG